MKTVWLAAVLLAALLPTTAMAQEGACCFPPCYDCYIMTQQDCETEGGVWIGEGTSCDPNP